MHAQIAPRRTLFALGGTGLLGAATATPARAHHPAGEAALTSSGDLVRGFSKARLARFVPAFAREVERGSFPGCVAAIARMGEVIHLEAYGHQDAARTKPMARDSIFLQASMTKPMTSVLAMMLIEEGQMKLSDPIADHLPELRELKVEMRTAGGAELVAPTRAPTVQDLLRHTSGFVYGAAAPSPRIRDAYASQNIEARDAPITGEEMLGRLATIPLAWQPGSTFHYSISTDVLGLVVERVSGQRLDRFMAERLTGPLGMRDTAWFVGPDRAARLAEAPDSDPLKADMWRTYRIREDEAGRSYFRGGAGLVSTAGDYLRFATMVGNSGVLDGVRYLAAPTVGFMLSDHIAGLAGSPTASTGPGYGFGLGFGVRLADGVAVAPGSRGDAMWAGAWGTSFTIDREEGLVAVIMAQGPTLRGHTRMLFKNMVYGAMVESARG